MGDTLARLSAASSSSSNSKNKSKKESGESKNKRKRTIIKTDYTDEELFQATGGARFGMRAAPTKNLAKWRRTQDTVLNTKEKNDKDGEKVDSRPCEQTEMKPQNKNAVKLVSDSDDAQPVVSQEPETKRKPKEKKDKKDKKKRTKEDKDKKLKKEEKKLKKEKKKKRKQDT